MSIIAELTRPWERDEIKFRVGSVSKNKDKALPLAYVDARTVMDRLDKVLGSQNWQDRYEFHGNRTVCYLSIRIGGEWITKADGAGDSDVEAEKGGISDAFKRAAVKWGMGRELYEMKCRWMPIDDYKQLKGNPWDYLINKPQPDQPKEKEFDVETEYNFCIERVKEATDKEGFVTWWNSPEAKATRKRIKSLREDYYAEITAKMKEKIERLG